MFDTNNFGPVSHEKVLSSYFESYSTYIPSERLSATKIVKIVASGLLENDIMYTATGKLCDTNMHTTKHWNLQMASVHDSQSTCMDTTR